jgi:hypothetical protein
MAPPPEEQQISVVSLLKQAFDNYENTLKRYEKLLVDSVKLNAEILAKLAQIPTQENFRIQIGDILEEDLTREIDKMTTSLKNVETDLKTILIWLRLAVAVVILAGSVSIGYNNFVRQKQDVADHTIKAQSFKPHVDAFDKDGNKIVVPVLEQSPAPVQK